MFHILLNSINLEIFSQSEMRFEKSFKSYLNDLKYIYIYIILIYF
jgi:hypothetical protein